MIENFIKSGWRHTGGAISRRLPFISTGGWIAICVITIVGGRILWVKAENRRRDEIAIAFGRATLPSGTPQASHDGKRITLVQVGDKGLGVFLYDLTTGRSQLVHQKGAKQDIFLNLGVWPWSPDDQLFTYTAEDLVVCEAATGKELARFTTDGFNNVAGLVWLSAERFVYANRQGNLHLVQKQINGEWKAMLLPGVKRIGTKCLSALSKDTIAWQKENRIWTLNVDSNQAAILFELKTGKLNDFCYSRVTGNFLISKAENGDDSLWRITPSNASDSNRVSLVQSPSIHNVAWMGGNKGGFAYLSSKPHNPEQNFLTVEADSDSEAVTLVEMGNVSGFTTTADEGQLFAVGVVSNELAAGIWRYDLATKTFTEVVPCTDRPSPYAKSVEPMHGVLSLPTGRKLDYFVYPPADFDRHAHKKYPLILGNTLYKALDPVYQNRVEGPLWASALARCGAYVAIVERPGYWFNGIDQWAENVMAAYDALTQDPTIDTNRVFLFATSAETPYLNDLVREHPSPWAGLMQLNGATMDLSTFPLGQNAPRILLAAGKFEGKDSLLKSYQEKANQNGVSVDVVIHPDSAHVLMGKNPLTQKNRAITEFIFDE